MILKGIILLLLLYHFIHSVMNRKDWDYKNYELLVSLVYEYE